MKKRWTIALLALLLASTTLAADLPPGKWWRRPELVQMLTLTTDQQDRLEAIFRGAANELIDLRGEVEKQNIALRGELDQTTLDRKNIQHSATKLSEARGRLFERELMMLVDMRGVLSETQWSRMRAELDRMGGNRPPQQPRPNLQRRRQ